MKLSWSGRLNVSSIVVAFGAILMAAFGDISWGVAFLFLLLAVDLEIGFRR